MIHCKLGQCLSSFSGVLRALQKIYVLLMLESFQNTDNWRVHAKSNGKSIQKFQAQDPDFPFYIIIIYINILCWYFIVAMRPKNYKLKVNLNLFVLPRCPAVQMCNNSNTDHNIVIEQKHIFMWAKKLKQVKEGKTCSHSDTHTHTPEKWQTLKQYFAKCDL